MLTLRGRKTAVYLLLMLLLISIGSGCSTQKHATKEPQRPAVRVDASDYIKGRKLSKRQKNMIKEACTWQGTPYKYGGSDKGKGTDCSGFVLCVYRDVAKIKLPRNSAKQAEFCKKIKRKNVRACDLVFFATGSNKKRVSHVGMMLDRESFIHASSSKGVIVTRLDNKWWSSRILGFGRVPGFK